VRVPRGGLGRALELIGIGVASLVLSVGMIAVLSGFFAGRDQANVSGLTSAPGQTFRDQGHAQLQPAELRPAYNSDPPTSGPHVPEPVPRDGAQLNDDQLLEALQVGDVVIMYGTRPAPAGLSELARAVAGAFTPALASAGQAVILARRPGVVGVVALAWTHMLRVGSASDPGLRRFAEFWLGRGAPSH